MHCPHQKVKRKITFKIQLLKADEGIMWTAWLADSVWKNNSGEKEEKKKEIKNGRNGHGLPETMLLLILYQKKVARDY